MGVVIWVALGKYIKCVNDEQLLNTTVDGACPEKGQDIFYADDKEDGVNETPSIYDNRVKGIDYSQLPYNMEVLLADEFNKSVVYKAITHINDILKECNQLIQGIPDLYIKLEDIIFSGDSRSYIEYSKLTKTGKIPKYIAVFHCFTKTYEKFDSENSSWGEVYYMKDGSIGKATITSWRNSTCYVVNLAIVDNMLSIKSISTNTDSGKEVLYKQ